MNAARLFTARRPRVARRAWVAWATGFVLLAGPVGGAAATISYPASGQLDLREGTIELWFSIAGAADAPVTASLAFFHFHVPDHFTFSASWLADNRRLLARPSEVNPIGRNRMLGNIWKTTDLYSGRPYHLAFTWKGRDMAYYLNGEQIGRRNQAIPFTGRLARTRIDVGSRVRGTPLVTHALRVSDVARAPLSLAAARPTADLHTTLLDIHDQPEVVEQGRTRPRVESGPEDERGGQLSGAVRYIDGPMPGLHL